MSRVVNDRLAECRCCEEERKEGEDDHGDEDVRVGQGRGRWCSAGTTARRTLATTTTRKGMRREYCVCVYLLPCFSDHCVFVQLAAYFLHIFFTATDIIPVVFITHNVDDSQSQVDQVVYS